MATLSSPFYFFLNISSLQRFFPPSIDNSYVCVNSSYSTIFVTLPQYSLISIEKPNPTSTLPDFQYEIEYPTECWEPIKDRTNSTPPEDDI